MKIESVVMPNNCIGITFKRKDFLDAKSDDKFRELSDIVDGMAQMYLSEYKLTKEGYAKLAKHIKKNKKISKILLYPALSFIDYPNGKWLLKWAVIEDDAI